MFDCHVHSIYSNDSKVSIEEGIIAAIQAGLTGLIFTDHFEVACPPTSRGAKFNICERAEILEKIGEKYLDNLIILKGIEVGVHYNSIQDINLLLKENSFDFIIASVHSANKIRMCDPRVFEGQTKESILKNYLETILYGIENFDNYDVIGHIGHLCRELPWEDKSMLYKDYSDLIDQILKNIINRGHGIEVNTTGFRRGLGGPIPSFEIIKRYYDLGGKVITIGSDSHEVCDIGRDFLIVRDKLKEIGFTYANYFIKREPVFYKL